jgi:hypothetical protein
LMEEGRSHHLGGDDRSLPTSSVNLDLNHPSSSTRKHRSVAPFDQEIPNVRHEVAPFTDTMVHITPRARGAPPTSHRPPVAELLSSFH